MPAWPTTLPKPLRSAWNLSPLEQVIRTNMDSGIGKVRRRTRAQIDTVNVAWVMSRAQFAAFRTWFEDPAECDGGAAWFDIDLMSGLDPAACESPRSARFVGNWSADARTSEYIQVSAVLEAR